MQGGDESWILGSPEKLKGGLLISGLKYLQNGELMKKHNIVAVVTALGSSQSKMIPKFSDIEHKRIQIDDDQCQDLKKYFNECYYFIQSYISKGNVLVHCAQGVSRSVSIVAAFLIKRNSWQSQEALKFIKNQRKIADPNQGFVEQLKLYQLSNNIVNKVK